jgi:hypothetical protein
LHETPHLPHPEYHQKPRLYQRLCGLALVGLRGEVMKIDLREINERMWDFLKFQLKFLYFLLAAIGLWHVIELALK